MHAQQPNNRIDVEQQTALLEDTSSGAGEGRAGQWMLRAANRALRSSPRPAPSICLRQPASPPPRFSLGLGRSRGGGAAAAAVGAAAALRGFMEGAGGRGAGPGGHLPQATGPTTSAADQAEAAAMRDGGGAAGAVAAGGGGGALAALPPVKIDADATQKYVLIEASDPGSGTSKYLVRGDQYADYHKDAARETLRELDEIGLRYSVLGGGRIKHDSGGKTVEIYGFSYGFPWEGDPRHDLSAQAVSEAYEGYTVSTSDAGY